ncbi:MAG: AsnC family transcriptional regulator [Promethearchaeota archaeon]|jgi:DNA-binding Lrp family transcriptional regulator
MDETDFYLLKKLSENSRLTYRELADMTNMSVSAIHKRIKSLEDEAIINNYTARPSLVALKYLLVLVFGTSNAKSMDDVSKELGQHESIYRVSITGGKYLIISAFIRDLSELQEFGSYVSRTAQISEPTIGIVNIAYTTFPEPLSSIDYKILKSLNRDARTPVTDIADDVGISAKTVKKRLDRMVEYHLADFSVEWSVQKVSLTTIFQLYLNEGTDINSAMQQIFERYDRNISWCLNYSNIPNFLTLFTWAKNTQESQRIQEFLQGLGFKDVIPHIYLSAEWYDCWVDKLLRTK